MDSSVGGSLRYFETLMLDSNHGVSCPARILAVRHTNFKLPKERYTVELLSYQLCLTTITTNADQYAEFAGAFFLSNGRQKMVVNPLTGASVPWKITRAKGCNTIVASENLLTFRSETAASCDQTM